MLWQSRHCSGRDKSVLGTNIPRQDYADLRDRRGSWRRPRAPSAWSAQPLQGACPSAHLSPKLHIKAVVCLWLHVCRQLSQDLANPVSEGERHRVVAGEVGGVPVELAQSERFAQKYLRRCVAVVFEHLEWLRGARARVGSQERHVTFGVDEEVVVGELHPRAPQRWVVAMTQKLQAPLAEGHKINFGGVVEGLAEALQFVIPVP